MASPTTTLNTNALTKLGDLFDHATSFEGAASAYVALISAANRSPELAGLLNTFSNKINSTFVFGKPDGGTFASPDGSKLTIDPNWVPRLAGSDAPGEPALTFSTTVAHELGHAVLQGGQGSVDASGNPATLNTVSDAINSGRTNEGVALVAEYITAKQLGVEMHSDQGQSQPVGSLTAKLDADFAAAGIDPTKLTDLSASALINGPTSTAVQNAGQWNGACHPSIARNLTYDEYNGDWFTLIKYGNIDPRTVDWSQMKGPQLNYDVNLDGSITLTGISIPLLDGGTASLQGTVSGPGAPISLTVNESYSQGSVASLASTLDPQTGLYTTQLSPSTGEGGAGAILTISGLSIPPTLDSQTGNLNATFVVGNSTVTVPINPTTGAVTVPGQSATLTATPGTTLTADLTNGFGVQNVNGTISTIKLGDTGVDYVKSADWAGGNVLLDETTRAQIGTVEAHADYSVYSYDSGKTSVALKTADGGFNVHDLSAGGSTAISGTGEVAYRFDDGKTGVLVDQSTGKVAGIVEYHGDTFSVLGSTGLEMIYAKDQSGNTAAVGSFDTTAGVVDVMVNGNGSVSYLQTNGQVSKEITTKLPASDYWGDNPPAAVSSQTATVDGVSTTSTQVKDQNGNWSEPITTTVDSTGDIIGSATADLASKLYGILGGKNLVISLSATALAKALQTQADYAAKGPNADTTSKDPGFFVERPQGRALRSAPCPRGESAILQGQRMTRHRMAEWPRKPHFGFRDRSKAQVACRQSGIVAAMKTKGFGSLLYGSLGSEYFSNIE